MQLRGSNRGVVVTQNHAWQWVARSIWMLAIAGILFVVIAVGLVPRLLSGAAVRVSDQATAPGFAVGDVVVARGLNPDAACQAKVNDVLLYLPTAGSPQTATRRVVSKSVGQFSDGTRCRLTVQGNGAEPENTISPIQVRGTMAYRIPKLGLAQDWAETHLALAASTVGTVLIGGWLASSSNKVKIANNLSVGPEAVATSGKPAKKKREYHTTRHSGVPRRVRVNPTEVAPVQGNLVKGNNEVLNLSATNPSNASSSGASTGRHLKKVVPPAERAQVLLKRETQIYEHEIALREAKLAHREVSRLIGQVPHET